MEARKYDLARSGSACLVLGARLQRQWDYPKLQTSLHSRFQVSHGCIVRPIEKRKQKKVMSSHLPSFIGLELVCKAYGTKGVFFLLGLSSLTISHHKMAFLKLDFIPAPGPCGILFSDPSPCPCPGSQFTVKANSLHRPG